jgi:hypothetical protein
MATAWHCLGPVAATEISVPTRAKLDGYSADLGQDGCILRESKQVDKCYSDILSCGYSDMSSPAMMLRLLLPRPLFTQARVRARTCTITIDITDLQSDRSNFKRNV